MFIIIHPNNNSIKSTYFGHLFILSLFSKNKFLFDLIQAKEQCYYFFFLFDFVLLCCMKAEYSVLHILNSICAKDVTRSEVNHLIELAHNYAYSYLKYRYKNLSRTLLAEDVTLQELAIEAIAPLFERDETGFFIKIQSAFQKWQPPIETEESVLFFLNRIAAKSTEKYVSELLRQSDPFFSKILDSVNYFIEKENYKKKQILGTTYIVKIEDIKKLGSLPDSKFINELPAEMFFDLKKTLPVIFEYLDKIDRSAVIPLNALVMKIKAVKSGEFKLADSYSNGNEIEIESITKKAFEVTISKMEGSYLQKKKINAKEANAIKKAIENIIYDMRDGGINPGLHKYLIEQIPEMTSEDYEIRYQNIFEYLFKILKKEIAEQLK